eukprot:sb/3466147/
MDGVVDCLNGEDEREDNWLKCGSESLTRYEEQMGDSVCREVLICLETTPEYIRMEELCDRTNTCYFENELCDAVKGVNDIVDVVSYQEDEFWVSHCFPRPIIDLEHQLGTCRKIEHTTDLHPSVFDLNLTSAVVNIPVSSVSDCSYFYGESYVYLSCNGGCQEDTTCPLLPMPLEQSCLNHPDKRVFTLADTTPAALMTVLRTSNLPGSYENRLFPCDNGNCVLYNEVCNLRDDCGDGTDEKSCNNSFRCTSSSATFLPLSSVCNGDVECEDFSDECQEQCSSFNKNIFANNYLRFTSFTIGFFATGLNLFTVGHSLWTLPKHRTFETFANKAGILLSIFFQLFTQKLKFYEI